MSSPLEESSVFSKASKLKLAKHLNGEGSQLWSAKLYPGPTEDYGVRIFA
jgi:hypothetical protein